MKPILRGKLATLGLLMLFTAQARAFDVHTHAVMTAEAVARTSIGRSPSTRPLLEQLGIRDDGSSLLREYYVDIGASPTLRRGTTAVEEPVIGEARLALGVTRIPGDSTISGWFMRGAIREDDNTIETPLSDEPGGVFNRVLGHFFDPVGDSGLSWNGVPLGVRGPDWALVDGVAMPGLVSGRNRYNLGSAREAMWRALTLKRWGAGGALTDDVWPSGAPGMTAEALRLAYWATVFRALGDVVHVLQDMAQPQHTRNDTHSGLGCVLPVYCIAGHASFMEHYFKARTLKEPRFTINEGIFPPPSPPVSKVTIDTTAAELDYGVASPYVTPVFASYREYFATATGAGNHDGKGLANYSNRGFYSFNTNIGDSSGDPYSEPPRAATELAAIDVAAPALLDMTGKQIPGTMTFFEGTVRDALDPGSDAHNVKLTAYGLWDQFLLAQGLPPGYTLNYYTYDEQARLLIPRAVAYSAGLIDFFFRGSLRIDLPPEGIYAIDDYSKPGVSTKDTGGFSRIKATITNTTPDVVPTGATASIPQAMAAGGTLVAVVKFRRNTCYVATTLAGEWPALRKAGQTDAQLALCRDPNGTPASEEIVVSLPQTLDAALAPDSAKVLDFSFAAGAAIPINAVDVVLQVVYRGPLGPDDADAVLVGTRDISEPTLIRLSNERDFDNVANLDAGGSCVVSTLSYQAGGEASDIDIGFRADAPQSYLATASLAPGQFSMVALLGNPGSTQLNFRVAGLPLRPDLEAASSIAITLRASAIDAAGALSVAPAARYAQTRGTYADEGVTATLRLGGNCTPITWDVLVTLPNYNPLAPLSLSAITF